MTLIDTRSGCKVGWETYDNEAQAKTAAANASESRERMFAEGYDFGYQWPGSIKHIPAGPDNSYGRDVWVVVTT